MTFSDDTGQPLDRAGVLTPGPVAMSFILRWYNGTTSTVHRLHHQSSTTTRPRATPRQAAADSGGTWKDLALGHAKYHFKTVLPASYDPTTTHTLGIYATRIINLTDPIILNKTYVDNLTFDFRPDGQARSGQCGTRSPTRPATPATIRSRPTATPDGAPSRCACSATTLPDDRRRQTGNSVDIKVFIHKIHMGADLPSVKAGHPYSSSATARPTSRPSRSRRTSATARPATSPDPTRP